jgi:hypothetical protein
MIQSTIGGQSVNFVSFVFDHRRDPPLSFAGVLICLSTLQKR